MRKQHDYILPISGPVFGSHRSLERVFADPIRAIQILVKPLYPTNIPSSSNQAVDSTSFTATEGEEDSASRSIQPLCFRSVSLCEPEYAFFSWTKEVSLGSSDRSRTHSNLHNAPCVETASAKSCLGLKMERISQPISKAFQK